MPKQLRPGDWSAGEVLQFGPFRLIPGERRLERDGNPVKIGDRALDVLLCLIANAPDVVGKAALIEHVWANLVIEEGNLRFQINALRRALAESGDGDRYLATVQGRGYAFVGGVTRLRAAELRHNFVGADTNLRLPAQHADILGRDSEISMVAERLTACRFVTVVGPGGVGKTTVAVAAAHVLLPAFDGAVRFVDFGALRDASLVPATLASLFGLTAPTSDPIKGLIALVHDQRLLLVMDSCEHVIDVAARIAEALFLEAPNVHLLLTSRESLRVEGELVVRLPPLPTPPPAPTGIDAVTAMAYPATQLFVNRVRMAVHGFELRDEDADAACDICRRLDGLPLAIELVAGRVPAFGIEGTLARLGEDLRIDGQGRRTAPPRHQTLGAMLDWSYQLLTPTEQAILRRLSILAGTFSMETAQAIGSLLNGRNSDALQAIAGLAAKSLLSVDLSQTKTRFRLLDTTRAYAGQKLRDGAELHPAMNAFAQYLFQIMAQAEKDDELGELESMSVCTEENVSNVRTALEWCFAPGGDLDLGVKLGAAAIALFVDMSLWGECKRWAASALAALTPRLAGSQWEMKLRAAYGLALMFTEDTKDQHRVELERSLEIAKDLGEKYCQLRIIGSLIIYYYRRGELAAALDMARSSAVVAGSTGNEEMVGLSDWFMGIALHFIGSQAEAILYCEVASRPLHRTSRNYIVGYGLYDHRIRALAGLARSLWLSGFHRRGVEEAEKTIAEAIELGHPVTICVALTWAGQVFTWNGDWSRAESIVADLLRYATQYSLMPHAAVSRILLGELRIGQGRVTEGIEHLSASLALMSGSYQVSTALNQCALAEGLLMLGRVEEGLELIDSARCAIVRRGGFYWLPEILRVKAALQARSSVFSLLAESTFLEATELAERQGAASLSLRIAMSLAECRASRQAIGEALDALRSMMSRFGGDKDSRLWRAALEQLDVLERDTTKHRQDAKHGS
ncbi:MAG: transcriptional regulator [Nevskia sp.]|nr:transcriptional regulator [Nevskia sp.]